MTCIENAFQQQQESFNTYVHDCIVNAGDNQSKIKQYYDIFDNIDDNISISHTYNGYEQSRILLTQYVTGSHCLEEEVGRWRRVVKEDRLCKLCKRNVENIDHFLIECPNLEGVRRKFANFPVSIKQFFKWKLCASAIKALHRARNQYGR